MKDKRKLLIIQETDWILRGPHQNHHLIGRLDQSKYDIRIVDFPIIWDKEKRREFPFIKKFHNLRVKSKVKPSNFLHIYRPPFINFPYLNFLSIFLQRLVIKRQIKKFHPEIVICFGSLLNVNYVYRKCKKNNIPFIYFLLEKYYTMLPNKFLRKFSKGLEHKAIKRSDINIVLNCAFKEYVDCICDDGIKNITVPGGIDLHRYSPDIEAIDVKKKYRIKEDDIVMFFMGWIYSFSGIMEVAQKVAESSDNRLKLMIVGEGGLYNELRKFVKKNNLENRIILTGWIPFEKVPEYISIADICLLPAYNNEVMRDIVPIKMYEYLGMGKPVVSTRLPGIMKEFGEDNGVFYVENPEQTLELATDLLEKAKNEGRKGRKFAEKYDWKEIKKKFEIVLNNLL